MRRTKIIATLGPATDKPDILEKLLMLALMYFASTTLIKHMNIMKTE